MGLQAIKPSVTAVVVNYNAGDFLLACVRSVLPQVSKVIVVDNASTDTSISKCKQEFSSDGDIVYILNDTNVGFSAGCNMGMVDLSDQHVLFINPDCCISSGGVALLAMQFNRSSSIGMVGGLLFDGNGAEQAGGRRLFPTPWMVFARMFGLHKIVWRKSGLFTDFNLQNQSLPDSAIEVEAISGACMLVRSDAIKAVGVWDEGYFLHCEDLDYCMRFKEGGWKVIFDPSVNVVHQKGVCSSSRPLFVEWHKHKGMLRFYRKFYQSKSHFVLTGFVVLGIWFRFGTVVLAYGAKSFLEKIGFRCG